MGVPTFIPNEALEKELERFEKFASGFRTVRLGCKDAKLKHVQSLGGKSACCCIVQLNLLTSRFMWKHQ